MKKKYIILPILILGLWFLFDINQSLAYQGDPNILGPNCTSEKHNIILNAIKNKDYNTWKNLMEGKGITKKITEQNFNRFTEMVQLRLNGKIEEANKIKTELGLGIKNGIGFKKGQR